MITIGFDFGTHQTKICCENIEAGTSFYDIFKFKKANGEEALTLPSYIRLLDDGTVRYGYEAIADNSAGRSITYFKQKMFSLTANDDVRKEAELWSVLYLAYIVFQLDAGLGTVRYSVHMGMPTDADPGHYAYCKCQAIKVLGGAMLLARQVFKGDFQSFLSAPYDQLASRAKECMAMVPLEIKEARKHFPILVFPEAYVALIPLIRDQRLPTVGPNLFVDIGGGTVDISFFTNQMDGTTGNYCPYLYYYYSMPYGLNVITGQDLDRCNNVEVGQEQITSQCVNRFRTKLSEAIDGIMKELGQRYNKSGRNGVMPFSNLCNQIMMHRPICYSGGGSMFDDLRLGVEKGTTYNFSQVTTVSELIEHSRLYIDDRMFHVLATAFALSHSALRNTSGNEPDSIKLVSVEKLYDGIRLPRMPSQNAPRISDATDIIPPNPRWRVGRDAVGEVCEEAEKRRKEEQQKKSDELREMHMRLERIEKIKKYFDSRIVSLKKEFHEGHLESAIKLAAVYLKHPGSGRREFEIARDWLNVAREKQYVDLGLLKLFESVCEVSTKIPDADKLCGHYHKLVNQYRARAFSSWNCVNVTADILREIEDFKKRIAG